MLLVRSDHNFLTTLQVQVTGQRRRDPHDQGIARLRDLYLGGQPPQPQFLGTSLDLVHTLSGQEAFATPVANLSLVGSQVNAEHQLANGLLLERPGPADRARLRFRYHLGFTVITQMDWA